jgi:hypothetical protein
MHKWLILLFLTGASASAAPAYTWVDKDGQVHYSDRPVPGAKRIELPSAPAAAAPATARAAPGESSASRQQSQQPQQPYTSFEVVRPAQQQTLWNIGGTLDVQLQLEPGLEPGDHIGIYLDGKLRDVSTTSLEFTVPEVYRGVHTLQAVIFNQDGDEILRSLAVTFMVQQTSILNPNNPNAPRRPNNAG